MVRSMIKKQFSKLGAESTSWVGPIVILQPNDWPNVLFSYLKTPFYKCLCMCGVHVCVRMFTCVLADEYVQVCSVG